VTPIAAWRDERWLVLAGSSAAAAERFLERHGIGDATVLPLEEIVGAGRDFRRLARQAGAHVVAIHSLAWDAQRHAGVLALALAVAPGDVRLVVDEAAGTMRRARRSALAARAAALPIEAIGGLGGAMAEGWRFARRDTRAHRSPPGPGRAAVLAIWLGEPGTAVGGAVTHASGILGGFRQLGLRVGLVTTASPPPQLAAVVDDVEIVEPLSPGARLSRDLHALALNQRVRRAAERLARRLEPGLVYQRHDVYLVAGADVAEELGVPLVLEWNASEVWTSRNWRRRLPLQDALTPLLARMERDVVRRAALVAAVSREAAAMAFEAGADPDRVAVVPNAVDLEAVDAAVAAPAPERAAGAVLGWTGSFGPWHGAEVLIEALAALPAGVELVLVGEGRLRARCEQLAADLGVADRVRFTGALAHHDALRTLGACDVLVSPHVPIPGRAFFGSPTKLFEYMALGRPIVASGLGQLGEVLDDGRTAALVAPGDAEALADGIRSVLARDDRGSALALAAREDAERSHTWDRRAKDVLERLGRADDQPPAAEDGQAPSRLRRTLAAAARSRTARQAALFAGSTALVGLLALAARALLARSLGPEAFGSFAFAAAALLLLAGLFEFGLLLPAGRAAARTDAAGRRDVAGAALLLYLPIGVAFAATVFGLSFVVDSWFHVEAGHALRVTAPLAAVYPFQQLALWLAQGSERLHLYSLSAAAGQGLFAGAVAVAVAGDRELTIELALAAQAVAFLVGWVPLVALLRPRLAAGARRMRGLAGEARRWAFQVYVGRVLSVATYNMDVLLVAALANARAVGVYAIAVAVARAVGLPTQGIANALFARLARDAHIERRWLAAGWAVGLAVAAVLAFTAEPLVHLVFSNSYDVGPLLLGPLALAEAIRGVTTLYNNALTAQARGRELRNAGLALTVANVALDVALIPAFGATGAAWASLGALSVNYAAHVLAYRRASASPGGVPGTVAEGAT
jgi:glycosyltransferase involved in cell wall biosynthesis/O-antigen/teichoic acid export membrane protein